MHINRDNDDLNQKKREQIDMLITSKKRVVASIEKYSSFVMQRQKELDEINKRLCEIQGHQYGEWEKKKLDAQKHTVTLVRYCSVCNDYELTNNQDEYVKPYVYTRENK